MSYYPPPPPPPDYPGGYASGPPAYNPYGGYQAPRGTNGLAIASLVVSLVSIFFCMPASAVGAIMGHMARNQIRESGEEGEGLALAGIIVGWIVFGLFILILAFYLIVIVWAINSQPPDSSY